MEYLEVIAFNLTFLKNKRAICGCFNRQTKKHSDDNNNNADSRAVNSLDYSAQLDCYYYAEHAEGQCYHAAERGSDVDFN